MKKFKTADLPRFDAAEHLQTEADIAAYLTIILAEEDSSALAEALGTVARARGMTSIAEQSGLSREALYKALRPGAQPRMDTVQRVVSALGLRLMIAPA